MFSYHVFFGLLVLLILCLLNVLSSLSHVEESFALLHVSETIGLSHMGPNDDVFFIRFRMCICGLKPVFKACLVSGSRRIY